MYSCLFLLLTKIFSSNTKINDEIKNLLIKIDNTKEEINRCERFLQMNDESVIKCHYERRISLLESAINRCEDIFNNLCLIEHQTEKEKRHDIEKQKKDIKSKQIQIINDKNVLENELKERINTIKRLEEEYRKYKCIYNTSKLHLIVLKNSSQYEICDSE
ncbi:hypothetical protein EDEG_01673 [Edhazardia aedis USNM 41457]|uniref:Uncharacterized protein n=1 Tax=Edhazardia aedis (strain USNM 41457) TaxID=1003232 RepID=J9D964_EDHAE|nr:hypothetical protein EDEG_01673 [Edhazardia aedis USNM 41457]|eukprot:EJW04039.1 hypothetical protein EDEG_01673 [Edhazardia aedis USNM 41457]